MSVFDNYQCEGQLTLGEIYGQDIWSGKTFPEPSVQTKEKTSDVSLKKRSGSSKKMPLFLDLRGGQKWSPSGTILGDGWSVAWRVHDAQFWGVPQRRKRIALVADFGGESAPEILFESESLSGDIEKSREEGQGITGIVKDNIDETGRSISFQERSGKPGGARESSYNTIEQEPCQPSTINQSCSKAYGISSFDSNAMKSSNPHSGIYEADTTRTLDNNGGNPACNQGGMIVLEGNGSRPSHKGDGYKESDVSYTLNSTEQHSVCYGDPITASKASFFTNTNNDGIAETFVATDYKDPQLVCYGLDRASFNQGQNAQYDFSVEEDLAQTIVSRGPGGVMTQSEHCVPETTKE